MNLKAFYFLRHAVALEREDWEGEDSARPLTREGEEKMQKGAKAFRKFLPAPEVILSSPFTRARQTAEIVRKEAFPHLTVETEELLKPGESLRDFLRSLRGRKEKCFVLVGHEPTMSEWILSLLGSRSRGSVRLKKGGCSLLEVDLDSAPPVGEMIFLLPPKVLRRLGS